MAMVAPSPSNRGPAPPAPSPKPPATSPAPGAQPIAVTDCLNFGDPDRPEIYFQLSQAVRGIADACRVFDTPVVSGNVSLYNESSGAPVTPTPVIGMLGVIEDVERTVRMPFHSDANADEGDVIVLLGAAPQQSPATLGASEYLAHCHDMEAGPVTVDLDAELALVNLLVTAGSRGLLNSAHDCSAGGLAVTLAESAIAGQTGIDCATVDLGDRLDAACFGEAGARAIVSVAPAQLIALRALADDSGVVLTPLGTVGGDRFRLGAALDLPLADLTAAHRDAFERAVGG